MGKKKVVECLMWLWKSFVGSQEITHIMSSGLLYLILNTKAVLQTVS